MQVAHLIVERVISSQVGEGARAGAAVMAWRHAVGLAHGCALVENAVHSELDLYRVDVVGSVIAEVAAHGSATGWEGTTAILYSDAREATLTGGVSEQGRFPGREEGAATWVIDGSRPMHRTVRVARYGHIGNARANRASLRSGCS